MRGLTRSRKMSSILASTEDHSASLERSDIFRSLPFNVLTLGGVQNVLIVGGSFSASGIAVDLAPFASSITTSIRVGYPYV